MHKTYHHIPHQHGFTMLELIGVIIIISVLGIFVFDRIWYLNAAAERATFNQTIGSIRSALGLEVARLALNKDLVAVGTLANQNPVPLLAQAPSQYLGEFESGNNITQKGAWYFDKQNQALVYNVTYLENFQSSKKDLQSIRHRIVLIYQDTNNNKRYDAGLDSISGLDLQPMEAYSWKVASDEQIVAGINK